MDFITDHVIGTISGALVAIGAGIPIVKKYVKKIHKIVGEVTEAVKAILDAFEPDENGVVKIDPDEIKKIKKEISDVRAIFSKPE